ncbi:Fcf2 pre-rRNA processing-domain-containing protein [Copromyces sp. CBS 386.78]|nr:Fcf2 pre-rRNA processing-domain-containing protein [Copromyces sp. CBS 386.78]
MAASVIGLSDAEIDKLLGEAESRLANPDSSNAVAAPQTEAAVAPAAQTPIVVAAPSAAPAGVVKPNLENKSKKLSVRVPQSKEKTKGPKNDAGADWFNMPRTNLTLQLKRDLQILRMREVVAMGKQYFKKDSRKDFVPEFSQVGTIIAGATDGRDSRLTRKERKRTIVEEVLGAEVGDKYKNKYHGIQEKKQSGGKNFYKQLVNGRRKRK